MHARTHTHTHMSTRHARKRARTHARTHARFQKNWVRTLRTRTHVGPRTVQILTHSLRAPPHCPPGLTSNSPAEVRRSMEATPCRAFSGQDRVPRGAVRGPRPFELWRNIRLKNRRRRCSSRNSPSCNRSLSLALPALWCLVRARTRAHAICLALARSLSLVHAHMCSLWLSARLVHPWTRLRSFLVCSCYAVCQMACVSSCIDTCVCVWEGGG